MSSRDLAKGILASLLMVTMIVGCMILNAARTRPSAR